MPIWTSEQLKAEALALGFDAARVTSVTDGWAAGERLEAFLDAGRHGDMAWMEETRTRRAHPRNMWGEARSALVLGMNYGPERDPMAGLSQTDQAVISVYADGRDYHDVLKKRLKRLARAFVEGAETQVKVFVDTAPLMEKPLAEKAGLGWQGKHTNLVSREFGSWLFLAVMLTDAALEPDSPEADHCGSCRACLDVCPTDAFPAPYQLDARRCISYLTIELDRPIPREFRRSMGNRIYGCDDCLAVCPWNKFASRSQELAFHGETSSDLPVLRDLAGLDDAGFRARFSGSPVKRIKRRRFLRNVAIALGNSGDGAALPEVEALMADPDPLIRGAAVWAFSQLAPERFSAMRGQALATETDADVRTEWA